MKYPANMLIFENNISDVFSYVFRIRVNILDYYRPKMNFHMKMNDIFLHYH